MQYAWLIALAFSIEFLGLNVSLEYFGNKRRLKSQRKPLTNAGVQNRYHIDGSIHCYGCSLALAGSPFINAKPALLTEASC
ncbi:hypothetical protein GCM10009332_05760 [Shewanella gelidii]|uniref:Uncharacterized protein n=1 Tax=Shewanella gelidii TaxID=1642821 RepID=A0A917JIQ8_9GAMM|nr:hypothetical protein GCM10009332_05760 [Shewanella gelidii]